jgi:hypothetical protein
MSKSKSPKPEEVWLSASATPEMLKLLRQHELIDQSPPAVWKLRLFFCGCCRLMWDLPVDDAFRQAVEVAERDADGQAGKEETAAAKRAVEQMHTSAAESVQGNPPPAVAHAAHLNLWAAKTARTIPNRHVPITTAEREPDGVATLILQS